MAAVVVLVALIAVSPLAMSFGPYPEIARDGVWAGTYRANASYAVRCLLIAVGLAATVIVGVMAVVTLVRAGWSRATILACTAYVAAWALGWRTFPYWINGVHRAEFAGTGMLDPKALPPMTWIGEVWRLPVLVGYPAGVVCAAIAVVVGVRAIVAGRGASLWGWGVVAAASIAIAVLGHGPMYMTWLMD